MSKKVTLKLEVMVKAIVDDNVEIHEIVNGMEYEFTDTTTQATIEDTEIIDFEVIDSK